jgi:hypothetical protein
MFSRVTLLEIDTMRVGVADAVDLFRQQVLPTVKEQEGYRGCIVFTTDEGKGMIVSLWATAEAADASASFASGELERFVTMFKSPPGREHYTVALADMPGALVG